MTHEEAYEFIKTNKYSIKTGVIFSSETMFAVEIQLFSGTQRIAVGLSSNPDLKTAKTLATIDAVETIKLRI